MNDGHFNVDGKRFRLVLFVNVFAKFGLLGLHIIPLHVTPKNRGFYTQSTVFENLSKILTFVVTSRLLWKPWVVLFCPLKILFDS